MRLASLADPAALAQAADENFVVHATWTLRHWVGTVWRPEPDLVIADSGLPCDTFNFICRARFTTATADSRIAAAIGHFRSVGRPAGLLRMRGPDLDLEYLTRWVEALGLSAEWAAAQQAARHGAEPGGTS